MLEVNNADQELANVVTSLQEATQSHLLRTTKTSKTKMTTQTKMTTRTKNKAEMRKSAMERGKRGREGGKSGEFRKCPVILLDDLDVNLYSAAASFAASDAANRMGPNPQLNSNGTIGTIGSIGSSGSNGTIGSFGPIRSIGPFGPIGTLRPIGPPTSPASSSSLSSSFGGSIASLTALDCFAVYAEKVGLAWEPHAQSSSLRPGFLKSVRQLIQHSKCPIVLTASALSVQVFMMIKHRAKSPPSRPIGCSSPGPRSPR